MLEAITVAAEIVPLMDILLMIPVDATIVPTDAVPETDKLPA